MTQTIHHGTLTDRLSVKLKEQITSGHWPAGSHVPTIRRLASEYGVSPNTVVLALRELEAADLIIRKPHGSRLVKAGAAHLVKCPQREVISGLIGVTSPFTAVDTEEPEYEPRDSWTVRIGHAAKQAILEAGDFYPTFIGCSQPEYRDYVDEVIEHVGALRDKLLGVLVLSANHREFVRLFQELDRLGLPWVASNRPVRQMLHNFVAADTFRMGEIAGRCFDALNCDKILFLTNARNEAISADDKALGVFSAFMSRGRPTQQIHAQCCGSIREEAGYQATREYTDRFGPPQGIFAAGDYLAAGAMRACRDAGLNVPGQVAVLGSTGLDLCRYTEPAMSVVDTPMDQMGRDAVRMLLEIIRTGERRVAGQMLAPRLILRGSLTLPPEKQKELADFVSEGLADPQSLVAAGSATPRELPSVYG